MTVFTNLQLSHILVSYISLWLNFNPLKVKVKVAQSCLTLCNPMDCPWNPPGQNTGVGTLSLLQGFLPTQGSNLGLPHCRWILYQLRHNGSPRIQEWVAYPFSSGSFWPRNQTGVSWIAAGFFTDWDIREAHALTMSTLSFLVWIGAT